MDSEINDIRSVKDFSKTTFSGFKKTEVLSTLLKTITRNNIESSCYWCSEIICSGYYIELWEIIILFVCKYIHIGNPKLSVYIENSINNFKKIVNEFNNDEIHLRNNENIRKMFAEIICILCKSYRKHPLAENKIKHEDYDMNNIGDKLKAPNVNYISNIFKDGDLKETYISLNELYYNINTLKDTVMSCYWIDWIIEFDYNLRKNKSNFCFCSKRNYVTDDSDKSNMIWIVWDIFLEISANKSIEKRLIESLLTLFILKFTKTTPKKRRFILYNCVSILTENINHNISIIDDKNIIVNIHNNIHKIYKQIQSNEIKDPNLIIKPDKPTKKTNKEKKLEKSMEKINIINNTMFNKF